MDSQERRRCMRLLGEAKRGGEHACEELTVTVARHFSYMIRSYSSVDPAFDKDDLQTQFQLGIWQAIPKVDGRGDPLFHLAWRGQQAVRSMLEVIKQRRHGTAQWLADFGEPRSIGTLPEGFELPDPRPEAMDLGHELMLAEDRAAAARQVAYLEQHATLTPRQQQVLDWMRTTRVGVDDKEANVRLATILHISPQAASVHRRKVLEQLGMVQTPAPALVCARCGGEFGNKGALTQHQRGQSGHRPCLDAQAAVA